MSINLNHSQYGAQFKAYQDMRVDGHRNRMRGIDVPEGKNGLMAGMRTVHYGTIPDLASLDTGGDGCGGRLPAVSCRCSDSSRRRRK